MKGIEVTCDPDIADFLRDRSVFRGSSDKWWYPTISLKTFEVGGFNGRRHQQLHKLVTCPLRGFVVDHKNGDRMDCRRENLRLATHQENARNRSVYTQCRFKGVGKQRRKFQASICVDGKVKYIGLFDTEILAAQAYDAAAREMFGDFAKTNFQEKNPCPGT